MNELPAFLVIFAVGVAAALLAVFAGLWFAHRNTFDGD